MTQLQLLTPAAIEQQATTTDTALGNPLAISTWLAMSALQKAIRRDDEQLAKRAAATLIRNDPARLWRRLTGIAFEDVGLADLKLVAEVVVSCRSKQLRAEKGGDEVVAGELVGAMCSASKCRAADDLLIASAYHPEFANFREWMEGKRSNELLAVILNQQGLFARALAAWATSGARWIDGSFHRGKTKPAALFDALRATGTSAEVTDLCRIGYSVSREALPVLVAMLYPLRDREAVSEMDDEIPAVTIMASGIPTYALDMFSYEGLSTFRTFLQRDCPSVRWIKKHIPPARHTKVLGGALFRIEGGLVRRRSQWKGATCLLGLADSGFHGMPLPKPLELLELLRQDLPLLDEVRVDVR